MSHADRLPVKTPKRWSHDETAKKRHILLKQFSIPVKRCMSNSMINISIGV